FLYVRELKSNNNSASIDDSIFLVQYDLMPNEPKKIEDTRVIIDKFSLDDDISNGSLELAPDGKIYFLRNDGAEYISTIDNPDMPALKCDYQINSVYLKGRLLNDDSHLPIVITELPRYVDFGSDTVLCYTDSLVLRPIVIPNDEIKWSDNSSADTLLVRSSGEYYVTITNGSEVVSDTIFVEIIGKENLIHFSDSTFCDSIHLTLSFAASAAQDYKWSSGSSSADAIFNDEGVHWVQFKDTHGCLQNDTFSLSIKTTPTQLRISDTAVCELDSVIIQASPAKYQYWYHLNRYSEKPIFYSSGLYGVLLGKEPCQVHDTLRLELITGDSCLSFFEVPSAFSPNNDNLNDVFYPVFQNAEISNMQIFNRWGECVFESDSKILGWDGKFKNSNCPVGIYLVRIEYLQKEEYSMKPRYYLGSVLLTR
ncbi:MAG: gliding motility-associated C-terminal domain-containing protein, partial [Bacteroidetes bacterium]|nr:gliding motility-associated C-terminal domain-containing protein [Bacteroidota bacterium]